MAGQEINQEMVESKRRSERENCDAITKVWKSFSTRSFPASFGILSSVSMPTEIHVLYRGRKRGAGYTFVEETEIKQQEEKWGVSEGVKMNVEFCRCRGGPSPLSFSFSQHLYLLLSVRRSERETAFIPSCLVSQKRKKRHILRRLTYLCQNVAMRLSSADKLPPPASFFNVSSSNTLTQNPWVLFTDNKNKRRALGVKDGMIERTNGSADKWEGCGEGQIEAASMRVSIASFFFFF